MVCRGVGESGGTGVASVVRGGCAGLSWETSRRGLSGFVNDSDNAPGRINVMDYRGATVIADYGHNPDAMRALVSAVDAIPAKRRSVVIKNRLRVPVP